VVWAEAWAGGEEQSHHGEVLICREEMVPGLPQIRDRGVAEWGGTARGQVPPVIVFVLVAEKRFPISRESPAIQ
jgi:hypothetical protein